MEPKGASGARELRTDFKRGAGPRRSAENAGNDVAGRALEADVRDGVELRRARIDDDDGWAGRGLHYGEHAQLQGPHGRVEREDLHGLAGDGGGVGGEGGDLRPARIPELINTCHGNTRKHTEKKQECSAGAAREEPEQSETPELHSVVVLFSIASVCFRG